MSLEGRIRRIERHIRPKHCPECGQPWGKGNMPRIEVHLRTYGDPEPEPEYCPRCGRRLDIVLQWRMPGAEAEEAEESAQNGL